MTHRGVVTEVSSGAGASLLFQCPLIDAGGFKQWTEDLTGEQVHSILSKVPLDCKETAAEISAAMAAGNVEQARRLAHRLKGMASNLGASRLAQVARNIELGSDHALTAGELLVPLAAIIDATNTAIAEIRASI